MDWTMFFGLRNYKFQNYKVYDMQPKVDKIQLFIAGKSPLHTNVQRAGFMDFYLP